MTALPNYDTWRTAEPPDGDEPDPCAACDDPRTERDEAQGSPLCERCRAEEER